MLARDATIDGKPYYAVIDPASPGGPEMIAALGSDFVELESPVIRGVPSLPHFRVRVGSLGTDQLVGICRWLAPRRGMSEAGAFFEAVMGSGIVVAADSVFVCPDPAVGRAYFASRDRSLGRAERE